MCNNKWVSARLVLGELTRPRPGTCRRLDRRARFRDFDDSKIDLPALRRHHVASALGADEPE